MCHRCLCSSCSDWQRWLYRRSQGLVAPLAFHAFNNALAAFATIAVTKALNPVP